VRDLRTPRAKNALPYHGSGGAACFLKPALFITSALLLSGCGMTMQLDSLLPEKSKLASADRGETTGSIPKSSSKAKSGHDQDMMSLADWSLAGAALREALKGKDDNASMPWRNPDTGSGGTVTLVAAAYSQDGFPCRNFIASNVREGKEAWFSGTACRVHRGEWDIRSTRPLQKS
jgi:surface antigen